MKGEENFKKTEELPKPEILFGLTVSIFLEVRRVGDEKRGNVRS